MRRTYITTIALQQNLKKALYQPYGFFLENNRETCFPIIPIIENTYQSGDEVQIIVIRMGNTDVVNNYNKFLQELSEIGISGDKIKTIDISDVSSQEIGVAMFKQLIRQIPEESCINADITYGTKPVSLLVFTALNDVEKIKNVVVERIFYGEIPWNIGLNGARLHDLTLLKNLSDAIEQLTEDKTRETQVFISYRRNGGDAFAFLLYDRLTKDRYSVFLDVKGLHSGEFPSVLEAKIRECTDFLLILSEHCLDRCTDPKDFVRREIECALENGKNIVPIVIRNDFKVPDSLPDSLRRIPDHINWFRMDDFEEFDNKLKRLERDYLHSRSLSGR